jgi:hypothetical protein
LFSSKDNAESVAKAPILSDRIAREHGSGNTDREPGRPIELAGKKQSATVLNVTLRLARRAITARLVVMQKIANCIAIAQAQIIAPPLLAKRAIGLATGQKRPLFQRMELARRLRS